MKVDPLFIIVFIIVGVVAYFFGTAWASMAGILGLCLLINKLITQFFTIRMSLRRWENVVDKFESALNSPVEQARKGQE